jgi:SAM-dependent methyltransferase
MYQTEIFKNESNDNFDWETYFSKEHLGDIIKRMDPVRMISKLRTHLMEDKFRLSFSLTRLMRELLKGIEIKSPKILELGAATGFLTRWLISQYGGTGVLVDKSKASFKTYNEMQDGLKKYITYLNVDLFHLELEEEFDLICSFGLIEHFVDKQAVLAAHKKFAASNANIIILVPLDSPLTRAFLEVHPELNLGYRELLSEKEFKRILARNALHVIRMNISHGYCYDFVAAACHCP